MGEPESHEALDEAIENLFGYDWLIFRNVNAVNFFLRRFQTLGHEISELDSVRVCGVGEAVVHRLEESPVHVDVIPDHLSFPAIYDAIETFVGGCQALPGLNFLVPTAGTSVSYLQQLVEDAGGRVDLVKTYRTCLTNDSSRINALLMGGGIDCVAFTNLAELHEFAEVFDTDDLRPAVRGRRRGFYRSGHRGNFNSASALQPTLFPKLPAPLVWPRQLLSISRPDRSRCLPFIDAQC